MSIYIKPFSSWRRKYTHNLEGIRCVIMLGHHYSVYVISSDPIVCAPRIILQIYVSRCKYLFNLFIFSKHSMWKATDHWIDYCKCEFLLVFLYSFTTNAIFLMTLETLRSWKDVSHTQKESTRSKGLRPIILPKGELVDGATHQYTPNKVKNGNLTLG